MKEDQAQAGSLRVDEAYLHLLCSLPSGPCPSFLPLTAALEAGSGQAAGDSLQAPPVPRASPILDATACVAGIFKLSLAVKRFFK